MDFQIFKQLDKHAVARNVIVSTPTSLPPTLGVSSTRLLAQKCIRHIYAYSKYK